MWWRGGERALLGEDKQQSCVEGSLAPNSTDQAREDSQGAGNGATTPHTVLTKGPHPPDKGGLLKAPSWDLYLIFFYGAFPRATLVGTDGRETLHFPPSCVIWESLKGAKREGLSTEMRRKDWPVNFAPTACLRGWPRKNTGAAADSGTIRGQTSKPAQLESFAGRGQGRGAPPTDWLS